MRSSAAAISGGSATERPSTCISLLSDAEARKDLSEQIIGGEFSCDLGKRLLSLPQLFGHQLAGPMFRELQLSRAQVSFGADQRIEVPASSRNRAGIRAEEAHAFLQMRAQRIDSFTGRSREVDTRRIAGLDS